MGGFGSYFSVEFSLSTLGPVGGFGVSIADSRMLAVESAFDASPGFGTSASSQAPERLCCLMIRLTRIPFFIRSEDFPMKTNYFK